MPRQSPTSPKTIERALELLGQQLKLTGPASIEEVFSLADNPKHRQRDSTARIPGAHVANGLTQESSKNWSGPYVRAREGESFVLVEGTWKVPTPFLPPDATAGNNTEYVCSTWIGLDGHDQASLSLPQIGTVQSVCASQPEKFATGAWWQWWVRGSKHNRPIFISPDRLPVKPGDMVYCRVKVISFGVDGATPAEIELCIKNKSSGESLAFNVLARTPLVDGVTAEWIVERQTKVGSDDLLPFANFGSVRFEGCTVHVKEQATGYVQKQQLRGAKLIRMTDWTNFDQLGRTISSAVLEEDNGSAAQVFFVGHSQDG